MSDFSEYEKMPKNFNKLEQSTKAFSELNKLKWVVTEKVHGANFSFIYQDKKLNFAKRKELLKWSDDFFGFQMVVHNIENQILSLFEQLSLDTKAYKYVIYGELFGGKYPHADVVTDDNVQAIQTGVYYAPSVGFCAFDIAFEINGLKHYLDYETAVSYFEAFDIFHAKILFAGKLNEALNFNTRINSTVPALLGLPALENNIIEGVVIKPLKHQGLIQNNERPVVKLKNSEFDEEKKFHEAEKWSYIPDVSSNAEELTFLIDDLRNYITDNRLNSVLSKTGQLDHTNPARMNAVEKEFIDDVLLDFNINNDNIFDDITLLQREWIINRLKPEIVRLIDDRMKVIA